MDDNKVLQAEQAELISIFSVLPQELRDKLLDMARMSEIFASIQANEVA